MFRVLGYVRIAQGDHALGATAPCPSRLGCPMVLALCFEVSEGLAARVAVHSCIMPADIDLYPTRNRIRDYVMRLVLTSSCPVCSLLAWFFPSALAVEHFCSSGLICY